MAVTFQTSRFIIPNSDLSINSATLVGVVCAPKGFIFNCGVYHSWAYDCLKCLAHNWAMPLLLSNCARNCSQMNWYLIDQLPWIYITELESAYKKACMIQDLLPLVRPCFPGLEWVQIIYLSLILEDIAKSTTRAIAVKQKFLDSLIKIVLNNRIALDYLLAEKGSICVVINTTFCTWFDTPGEVEIQLCKITEPATWLKKVVLSMGSFFDLLDFDWFGS